MFRKRNIFKQQMSHNFYKYINVHNPYRRHACLLLALEVLVPGEKDTQVLRMSSKRWKSKPRLCRTNRLNLFWNTFRKWNKKGERSPEYIKVCLQKEATPEKPGLPVFFRHRPQQASSGLGSKHPHNYRFYIISSFHTHRNWGWGRGRGGLYYFRLRLWDSVKVNCPDHVTTVKLLIWGWRPRLTDGEQGVFFLL